MLHVGLDLRQRSVSPRVRVAVRMPGMTLASGQAILALYPSVNGPRGRCLPVVSGLFGRQSGWAVAPKPISAAHLLGPPVSDRASHRDPKGHRLTQPAIQALVEFACARMPLGHAFEKRGILAPLATLSGLSSSATMIAAT